MKFSACMLCDRATVREGLIHVLGGGITRMGRPQLPAPLGVDLALVLAPEGAEELPGDHNLDIRVRPEAGAEVARINVTFSLHGLSEPLDPLPTIPVPVPLQTVLVSAYGFYMVVIRYDDQLMGQIRFLIEEQLAVGTTAMLAGEMKLDA